MADDILTSMTSGDWTGHTELGEAVGRYRAVMQGLQLLDPIIMLRTLIKLILFDHEMNNECDKIRCPLPRLFPQIY